MMDALRDAYSKYNRGTKNLNANPVIVIGKAENRQYFNWILELNSCSLEGQFCNGPRLVGVLLNRLSE